MKQLNSTQKHQALEIGPAVKKLLVECNLLEWWKESPCNSLSKRECRDIVNSILFRLERAMWNDERMRKPKLRTYNTFKHEYLPEPYTNLLTCRAHRSFLARLRGGSAPLEIETGRYVGTPADQRVCKLCHSGVEDELHFVLTCPSLDADRQVLFNFMRNLVQSYELLSLEEKLCSVMLVSNNDRKVAKHLYRMYIKRQTLLNVTC